MLRALTTPRHSPRELSSPAQPEREFPLDLLHAHWSHFAPDLLSRDEESRTRAASELRRSVEQDLQSLSFDDSSRLVDDLTNRVFDLVNSSDTVDKLGGLTLLQQLLTMRAEQHDTILLRCMNVFRILFQQATLNAENRVIDLAARVLGFLCHTGAALTVDVANYHIRQALEWLSTPSTVSLHPTAPSSASSSQHFDRIDRRHLAAVYILRELSAQSPAIFASYLPQFTVAIWQGLKDARPETREASVAAVRNVLMDVSKRSPLMFANTCEHLYDEARNVIQNLSSASPHPQIHPSASASSLSVPSSPLLTARQIPRSPQPVHSQSPVAPSKRTSVLTLPALHASFLILTQLTLHNRRMMLGHFTHVCELAYKHRDTRDQHVIRALLLLLPLLASLRVDSFLANQAEWMVDYILQQASAAGCVNGDLAMAALSQLMGTLGEAMVSWVDGIVAAIMHVLASTSNVPAREVSASTAANGSLLGKRKDKERELERLKRMKRTSEAALECVGVMAKHLSLAFYPFADQLLDSMLRCPLSPALIASLSTITNYVPALTGDIQERLADMIINVLSAPFMDKDKGTPAVADGPNAASAIAMQGHGHSYSISSFSALSSFSATTGSMPFLPLSSPSSTQSLNTSFTSLSTSPPLPPPAVDINQPTSPYQLPRHLQLHRLLPYPTPSLPDSELVLLAFSTLSTFPFSFATQFSLLALARFTMLNYMDDDNLGIRREAAVTTLQLISKVSEAIAVTYPLNATATTNAHSGINGSSHTVNGSHLLLVCYDVVRKLIVLAVTDQSLNIRSSLLSLLVSDIRLDRFLLQSDVLSTLFLALHDEYSAIREAAILLLGRLSNKNPAVILPTLRRMLLLLLGEMQAEEVWGGAQSGVRGGGEGRRGLSQEEGAKMLGQLIGSCHALIKPYVDSILGVLVPKLGDRESTSKDGQGSDGMGRRKRSEGLVSSVLSTLGKLSVICGEDMSPFLDHLMPLLLEALYPPHMLLASASATATIAVASSVAPATVSTAASPPTSDNKQMTLRTLSLLLSSTSSVIAPFIKYPHFLPCLLHLVRTDKSKAVRLECLRVIGVVGAIDPFEYRKCQSEWVAVMGEAGARGLSGMSQGHSDGRMVRRGTSDSVKSTSVLATSSIKADKDKAEVKDEAKRDESADNIAAVADGLPGGSPLTRQAQPGEAPPLNDDDDAQVDIYLCQSQSYDEYYPSVAISSLMRVVVDPRLLSHHSLSLSALMFILKSLGRDKCQPFLISIIPVLLREMRGCDDVLRESYLQRLSSIVQLVGSGVKEWVEEMMDLALHFWPLPAVITGLTAPIAPVFTANTIGLVTNAPPPLLLPILSLFEEICVHLPSFFPTHLPALLAKFLALFADHPTEQNIASARCVLASLSVFSAHADLTAHLHFILPSLLDLCEEEDERSQRRPINLRVDAVHAVGQLCYHHDCSSQASRILQPFARILASPTNPAAHVMPTAYSAIVSASPSAVHSVANSAHSSPTIRSVSLSASLLWSETLSAVCTIIPQLSFAFLLFEPIVTRAIREHERADKQSSANTPLNGATHPAHERFNSRVISLEGRGLSRADSDKDRDGVWKEREAVQVARYFGIVERLKEKLNELKRTTQRDSSIRLDEEDDVQREKERNVQERQDIPSNRDKDRRRKDRRGTTGRMTSHTEKDRDKEREREQTAERERREQLRDKERDTIAFFPVIASASSLSMDDLDDSGYMPSPARLNASPGTSPAWQVSNSPPPADGDSLPPLSLSINQQTLVRFFSSYHHSSSDDWTTWLRSLQLELLRESPSFALRACSSLAGKYPPVARELMCAAFLSCWRDMDDQVKDQIIDAVISILTAATQSQPASIPVPADIVLSLLSLCDYCEQHDQRLPLRHNLLGAAAERYNSHARALYHYECVFHHNPSAAIEPLILVNNKLQLNDAAQGVLAMALRYEGDGIGEQWYEKLHRWDDALAAYERRQLLEGEDEDTLMGRMRCMKELQQWERLAALGSNTFLTTDDVSFRTSIAPLVSAAVHQLRCWDLLEPYLPYLNENSFDGCYYRALYALHMDDSVQAQQYIDRACECVDGQLSGLLGESYTRAYGSIVRLQQCTELSEMIAYKGASEDRKAGLRRMWSARLLGARRSVGVWSELLSVRALMMTPKDDVGLWLVYATLARKSGKLGLSLKVLTALVGFEPTLLVSQPPAPLPTSLPQLTYACLKHLYAAGHQRSAFNRLSELLNSDTMTAEESRPSEKEAKDKLRARCYLKLGTWQMELMGDELSVTNFISYESTSVLASPALSSLRREKEDEAVVQRNAAYNAVLPQVLNYFHAATVCDPTSFASWHQYAMLNFTVVQRNKQRQAQLSQRSSMHSSAAGSTLHSKRGSIITLSGAERGRGVGPLSATSSFVGSPTVSGNKLLDIHHHIVPAMTGFFRSIWLQKFGDNSRQDVLRVLQLWFEYGARKEVEQAMIAGINSINIDTWLAVIPQLIARLHTPYLSIRALLHELIAKIGKTHPQALVYPLVVASKSHSDSRRGSAMQVLQAIRQHSEKLVHQASMVSSELVRVAILWHEMWHEAIEEASRHWFGSKNADGMLAALAPMHALMEKGPMTTAEQQFAQQYSAELHAAHNHCNRYLHSNSTHFLTKAWELYTDVFRSINKSLQAQQHIQLAEVSPKLLNAHDLQLAVPGSYTATSPIVRIARFHPVLRVIDSKQHPRRLTIVGSDGREYPFLLKGHEDLRQDERVMQLFGMVNTFLQLDRSTARSELNIVRYAVIPLSPNSGLIQWVPACDTLHALIKQYRDAKCIQLNVEQRLMLNQAPDVRHHTPPCRHSTPARSKLAASAHPTLPCDVLSCRVVPTADNATKGGSVPVRPASTPPSSTSPAPSTCEPGRPSGGWTRGRRTRARWLSCP